MNSTVMQLTSLLLLLFIVRFSETLSVEQGKAAFPRFLKFHADEWPRHNSAVYIPERWRFVELAKLQAPEVEIQLLKEHVDQKQNVVFGMEYKFSSPKYKSDNRMEDPRTLGNKVDENVGGVSGEEVPKGEEGVATGRKIPQFDSRTIIDAPSFGCPPNQKPDPTGVCRPIV